jgi:hypothetical protein
MEPEIGYYILHDKSFCINCWTDIYMGYPSEQTSWHIPISAESVFKRPIKCAGCGLNIPVKLEN